MKTFTSLRVRIVQKCTFKIIREKILLCKIKKLKKENIFLLTLYLKQNCEVLYKNCV